MNIFRSPALFLTLGTIGCGGEATTTESSLNSLTAEMRKPAEASFIRDIQGQWIGDCDQQRDGNTNGSFSMGLNVGYIGIDQAGKDRYTWEIVYPNATRDYELVVIDQEQGVYQVDEKNGFIIDYLYTGGELRGTFEHPALDSATFITTVKILNNESINFKLDVEYYRTAQKVDLTHVITQDCNLQ